MSTTGPLVYIYVQNRGCGYLSEIRTALMKTQTSISLQTPLIFKNKDHDLHVWIVSHIMIGIMKGSLTLAMGKCLWFSVKIKVCQSSLSSP